MEYLRWHLSRKPPYRGPVLFSKFELKMKAKENDEELSFWKWKKMKRKNKTKIVVQRVVKLHNKSTDLIMWSIIVCIFISGTIFTLHLFQVIYDVLYIYIVKLYLKYLYRQYLLQHILLRLEVWHWMTKFPSGSIKYWSIYLSRLFIT